MSKSNQPFEKDQHDLTGHASLDFSGRDTFSTFSQRLAGYSPERFAPVALRVFFQKGEPIVTLYAQDKMKKGERGKIPVKKFKIRISFDEFIGMVKRFDFTVSDGKFNIRDIVVTNK